MARIFISYRRADSGLFTERIHDRLVIEFGKENVFLDVDRDNIPPGSNFPDVLRSMLNQAEITLVIIGPGWLDIREADDPNLRRLDNPADFVRVEVESSLKRGDDLRVIPVLVDGAKMPDQKELAETLKPLTEKQAIVVRRNPDFHDDMSDLCAIIVREAKEREERQRRKAEAEEAERQRQEALALEKSHQDAEAAALEQQRQIELAAQSRQLDSSMIAEILGYPIEWATVNRDGRLAIDQVRRAKKSWLMNDLLTLLIIVMSGVIAIGIFVIIPENLRVVGMICGGLFGFYAVVFAIMGIARLRQRGHSPLKQLGGRLGNVHEGSKSIEFSVDNQPFFSPYPHEKSDFIKLRAFEGQNVRVYYIEGMNFTERTTARIINNTLMSMELVEDQSTNEGMKS